MKRILCILLILTLSIPFRSITSKGETVCSAKSAIVMESTSEEVLFEKNADQPLPQASTTKIMTALVVLESVETTQILTVSEKAAAVEGSQLGLCAGDRVSVSDLLYILMLKSGNDAAEALAEGVAGSVSGFVEKMNRKAEGMGLKNTRFENPHGLPAEGHYTTARDLARLTAAALENPQFRAIVSTKQITLTYKNAVLSNSNKLLDSCPGIFGVKTGFTKKAGRCLVSAAERNGVSLICVTLNDPNDWQDHAALYEDSFSRVERRLILAEQEYAGIVPVLGATGVTVRNSLPLSVVTVDGEAIAYTLVPKTVPRIFPPVAKGRTLGYLQAVAQTGRVFSSTPLNTVTAIEQEKEERTYFSSFLLQLRKLWRALTSKTAF